MAYSELELSRRLNVELLDERRFRRPTAACWVMRKSLNGAHHVSDVFLYFCIAGRMR